MTWTLQKYRGANTNNATSLNINSLVKRRAIVLDAKTAGSWCWRDSTGTVISTISYESDTRYAHNSFLKLSYTFTDTSERVEYEIRLSRTKPNYGGERFWFLCPYTGRRVSKLYMPAGGKYFASRHAYKLLYGCQSESAYDRALRKKWKLHSKIDPACIEYTKPKGMHYKTYERLLDEYNAHDEQCLWFMLSAMKRHGFVF